MKIRSLFLCTCMIMVPLSALVSHRLPGGVVQAAGGLLSTVLGGAEPDAVPTPLDPLPPQEEPPLAAATGLEPPASPAPTQPVPPTPPVNLQAVGAASDQGELAAIHQRLAAAGAVGVDCRPLPGHASAVVATCRVGVDAEGSLFRMFQAHGSDPSSACRELLAAVEFWRAQSGVQSGRRPMDPQVGR